ncbi:unnamed protein product [Echinostoma caproni]|uniref:LAGLIDADG_2 domain-containing protein n=1 Tax=Echinostoma caproni TaxID=27848 RepID=A0A183AXJ6_9TREM|nr:unnamed protein product [Echinostoma caproni]
MTIYRYRINYRGLFVEFVCSLLVRIGFIRSGSFVETVKDRSFLFRIGRYLVDQARSYQITKLGLLVRVLELRTQADVTAP